MGYLASKVSPSESVVVLDPEEPPVRPMVEQAVRRRGARGRAMIVIIFRVQGFIGDCRVYLGVGLGVCNRRGRVADWYGIDRMVGRGMKEIGCYIEQDSFGLGC